MNLATARDVRKKIVNFGTKQNLGKMTDAQRGQYKSAKSWSRDAMRSLNNEREDVIAPAVGGIENVADDYNINEGAARSLATCEHIVQSIANEIG